VLKARKLGTLRAQPRVVVQNHTQNDDEDEADGATCPCRTAEELDRNLEFTELCFRVGDDDQRIEVVGHLCSDVCP
jgi:hypothetical protein